MLIVYAVYLISLQTQADEPVKSVTKITSNSGGFPDKLRWFSQFGKSVASLGFDFDDNGVKDMVIGAEGDTDGYGYGTG